jgi:hypothetical protein
MSTVTLNAGGNALDELHEPPAAARRGASTTRRPRRAACCGGSAPPTHSVNWIARGAHCRTAASASNVAGTSVTDRGKVSNFANESGTGIS